MSSSSDESDDSSCSSGGEEISAEQWDHLGKINFEKLKCLREKLNWENEEERRKFYHQLEDLIKNWKGRRPNLRDIFRPEEIDWLLTEDVKEFVKKSGRIREIPIIRFVKKSGYKDEPNVDENGKPLLRRATALHYVRGRSFYFTPAVTDLFKIYNRFDANYTDESGLTHLHVASELELDDIVRKFLDFEHDLDCRVQKTGDSPLHVALNMNNNEVALMLLRRGADPNLPNEKGFTSLHLIYKWEYFYEDEDREFLKMFFKIIGDQNRSLQLEARDKLGRTPLQWAVASFMPDAVDTFLDLGADLSSFVFPTESHLDERFDRWFDDYWDGFKLRLESGALAVLDCLKRRGYELERSDVLTIMKFFLKYKVFRKVRDNGREFASEDSQDDEHWYNFENFAKRAKKIMINPSLSLYELVRLRPGESEKRLTYLDCFVFVNSEDFWLLPELERKNGSCAEHLNEIMARGFCRRWALDPFMDLTSNRLPILCCEIILENLKNEDLCRVCLAAVDQSS
ncbi:uncharacterized protein LOC111693239 [Trichogramma pretiosum]|uniref:uncharacterized protein LOC111693239 n=1 Tax=Trichogramma pretiosum TaxID=7493 RepID=UPI000C71C968|nr:uncharacterized protein LOC111693239 [Trichogramma pretiosum]